ncbi:MAG: hypothetical protein FJZ64_04550 [Chlamydiae bacterium]|nr:hypothetical protein [Chlamydiota bacterium]
MALYATDGEEVVFALKAAPNHSYRCLECRLPVKVRRGKNRIPHFYHLRTSPSCHLYSKSEDHLLLQLQLKKCFPENELKIEEYIPSVCRIADLLWEKEKIVFEIQCSSLEASEAKQRIIDYRKSGYEIVWLFDDRLFNKRLVRPAEELLRADSCYYFSFNRFGNSLIYDQFEIIIAKNRVRKSRPMNVNLMIPRKIPSLEWPSHLIEQIQKKLAHCQRFFQGDVIHKTILSAIYPSASQTLEKWFSIEQEMKKLHRPPGLLETVTKECVVYSYLDILEWFLTKD